MGMRSVKVEDIIEDISMGPFGSDIKVECFTTSGVPLLNGSNLQKVKLIEEVENYVTEEKAQELKKALARPHDIIITHRGTLGQASYVPERIQYPYFLISQSQFRVRFNAEEVYAPYIAYYLHSSEGQGKLLSFKNHVGVPALARATSNFRKLQFNLPEIDEQKRIADTLIAFDEKIEHNNELIKMLEEQAQMVYDYWFVQFDFPDENGRPYRSSGGKMVWNEQLKREIPEGWDAVTLNNICKMYQPQTLSLAELDDNADYFVYGANGIIGKYKEYNHSESEVAIACRGNSCGTVNRTLPNSWITGNAMVLQMLDRDVSNEFILRSIPHIGIYRAISGSGQPQITRENLQKLKIAYPKNNGVLLEYTKIAVHIVHRLLLLSKENMHLTAQRDFLLPLLMSGQVKVAE